MARCGRFRLRNPIQHGLPSERGGISRRSPTRLPRGSGQHCASGQHVFDVVIVGAGQSGLIIGLALKREGVCNVL